MTQRISIELFSHLAVTMGEEQIARFRTQKTAVLLAYLALFSHRSHPREELIELLWPEGDMEAGRTSLRTALASLRRQIEPPGVAANSILVADRAKVQINPALLDTDVAAFEAAVSRARRAADPASRMEELRRALERYRGPLLPGFYEEWALRERTRLEQAHLGVLRDLAQTCEQAGDMPQALETAQRLAVLDPLEEQAHLNLMRLYAALGQQAAVKRQFGEWEQIAARELDEPPSAQARALLRQLIEGKPASPAPPTASPSSVPAVVSSTPAPSASALTPLPASSAPTRPSHLPVALTRFFGRSAEMAQAEDWLQTGETRLLTLTGPGGTGKTRLALEIGHRLAPRFDNAAWFVPLADVTQTQDVTEAIARALSLRPSGDVELLEQISGFLREHPALLLLDNFEQLPEDAAQLVHGLLTRVPSLACLVTSRHPLQLGGEQEFPIAPLPIPSAASGSGGNTAPSCALQTEMPGLPAVPAASLLPLALLACPSVQMFVDRARAARPDFQITLHNAQAITALCDRLEGIPLAIELTAAWAQILSPAQMLERLSRRFDLLTSRRKDLPARHRTLRAAVEWSYRLLSPSLQAFFARLTVFHGGWTPQAAEAVCEQPDAFDFLAELRQRSLVLVEEAAEEAAGDVRFRFLETLREYAREQLAPDERAACESRHLAHYAGFAETASPHLLGPEQAAWLNRLSREHDNIRAAFAVGGVSPDNQRDALRLAAGLWRFWEMRGYYSEGRAHCASVLAFPEVQTPTLERGTALNGAGNLAYHQGDGGAARQNWEASLAIWRTLENRKGMSIALGNLGNLASDEGDFPRARALYNESLAIKREIGGSPVNAAITLGNLGNLHMRENDYAGARDLYHQALRLHESAGNAGGKLIVLASLAAAAYMQGSVEEARLSYYDALILCRELGDRLWTALTLEGLARVACIQERDSAAIRLYHAAAALRDAIDTPIDPEDRQGREDDLNLLRRRMGEAACTDAARTGRGMNWEQAIEDALQTMRDAPQDQNVAGASAAALLEPQIKRQ